MNVAFYPEVRGVFRTVDNSVGNNATDPKDGNSSPAAIKDEINSKSYPKLDERKVLEKRPERIKNGPDAVDARSADGNMAATNGSAYSGLQLQSNDKYAREKVSSIPSSKVNKPIPLQGKAVAKSAETSTGNRPQKMEKVPTWMPIPPKLEEKTTPVNRPVNKEPPDSFVQSTQPPIPPLTEALEPKLAPPPSQRKPSTAKREEAVLEHQAAFDNREKISEILPSKMPERERKKSVLPSVFASKPDVLKKADKPAQSGSEAFLPLIPKEQEESYRESRERRTNQIELPPPSALPQPAQTALPVASLFTGLLAEPSPPTIPSPARLESVQPSPPLAPLKKAKREPHQVMTPRPRTAIPPPKNIWDTPESMMEKPIVYGD